MIWIASRCGLAMCATQTLVHYILLFLVIVCQVIHRQKVGEAGVTSWIRGIVRMILSLLLWDDSGRPQIHNLGLVDWVDHCPSVLTMTMDSNATRASMEQAAESKCLDSPVVEHHASNGEGEVFELRSLAVASDAIIVRKCSGVPGRASAMSIWNHKGPWKKYWLFDIYMLFFCGSLTGLCSQVIELDQIVI